MIPMTTTINNDSSSSSKKRPFIEMTIHESNSQEHNKKACRVTNAFEASSCDIDDIVSDESSTARVPLSRRVSDYHPSEEYPTEEDAFPAQTREMMPQKQLYQESCSATSSSQTFTRSTMLMDQQQQILPYRITPETSVMNLATHMLVETNSRSSVRHNGISSTTDESGDDCLPNMKELSGKLHEPEIRVQKESDVHPEAIMMRKAAWVSISVTGRKSPLSARRAALKSHSSRNSNLLVAIGMLLVSLFLLRGQSMNCHVAVDPNSVFVSGGGFSGFWFSIGRLQSIEDPASKNYYCYSAGCLAVVAALSNCTVTQMSDICFGVQRRWQEGETRHHDVVKDFLDHFLVTTNVEGLMSNEELLSKIHVITSVRDGWFGVKSAIRTPDGNFDNIYKLLLQTTWIPFATGEQLWERNESSSDSVNEYHMDGLFSTNDHPVCAHNLGLPWDWDLRSNALNVNLGLEKVEKFWNEGLAYGL